MHQGHGGFRGHTTCSSSGRWLSRWSVIGRLQVSWLIWHVQVSKDVGQPYNPDCMTVTRPLMGNMNWATHNILTWNCLILYSNLWTPLILLNSCSWSLACLSNTSDLRTSVCSPSSTLYKVNRTRHFMYTL